jgi:hypothetical protein
MNKTLIIGSVALVSLGLGYFIGTVKTAVDEKFAIVESEMSRLDTLERRKEIGIHAGGEDFDHFIFKFISDSLYQVDRVKFPLKSQQWDANEVDSTRIVKEEWKTIRLFWGDQYRPQIYDNFKREMRDTDERLFCWEGIENGINVEYRFSRINGLWYLTEFNDFSD